jgi:hypothetical protein
MDFWFGRLTIGDNQDRKTNLYDDVGPPTDEAGRKMQIGSISTRVTLMGAVLVLLTGCAFLFKARVDDLRLAEVRPVSIGEPASGVPAERKFVTVSVVTDYDLASMAEHRDIENLHADITYCGTADKVAWARIYEGRREAGGWSSTPDADRHSALARSTGRGPHLYSISFTYRSLAHRSGGGFVDYDLRKHPQDLCVVIDGAPYMAVGTGLESNTVVVPMQAITDAFQAAPHATN